MNSPTPRPTTATENSLFCLLQTGFDVDLPIFRMTKATLVKLAMLWKTRF